MALTKPWQLGTIVRKGEEWKRRKDGEEKEERDGEGAEEKRGREGNIDTCNKQRI